MRHLLLVLAIAWMSIGCHGTKTTQPSGAILKLEDTQYGMLLGALNAWGTVHNVGTAPAYDVCVVAQACGRCSDSTGVFVGDCVQKTDSLQPSTLDPGQSAHWELLWRIGQADQCGFKSVQAVSR